MKFEINDLVISSRFGIGQVTGIEKFGNNDQTFLSVSCRENHAKILVPQKELGTMRKVAAPDELQQALLMKFENIEWPSFASKKDRVLYFKKQVNQPSLSDRMHLIRHLEQLPDKGKVEDAILTSVEAILIKEVEAVFNITHAEAVQKVHRALRQEAA